MPDLASATNSNRLAMGFIRHKATYKLLLMWSEDIVVNKGSYEIVCSCMRRKNSQSYCEFNTRRIYAVAGRAHAIIFQSSMHMVESPTTCHSQKPTNARLSEIFRVFLDKYRCIHVIPLSKLSIKTLTTFLKPPVKLTRATKEHA